MSGAALALVRNRQLHVEDTSSTAEVPRSSIGRLMYYLKCVNDVHDCIPNSLTDYANYASTTYSERLFVIQFAKKLPPDAVPWFVEVGTLPNGEQGNAFLRFSSVEETITALGIRTNGAALTALQRQVAKEQLLEVMAFTPGWASRNYFEPLWLAEQEYQRGIAAPSGSNRSNSCTCSLL